MNPRALLLSRTPLRAFEELHVPAKPAEQRLLGLASNPAASPRHLRALARLAADPSLDWEYLLATAERHRVLPLLASHLVGATLPPGPAAHLRARAQAIARGSLLLVVEARRLLKDLAAGGVEARWIKGSPLAAQAWPRPELRHCADIDLLVAPGDALAAARLLLAQGCGRAGPHASLPLDEAVLRRDHEIALERRLGPHAHLVEIQWGVTDDSLPFRCASFGREPAQASVSGGAVPTLSPADHAALLFHHGCRHHWRRLSHVADVAALLAGPMDWAMFLEAAAAEGRRRQVLVGCALAARLAAAPLPPPVREALRRDRSALRLAAMARSWTFAEPGPPEYSPYDAFLLGLAERPRDLAEVWGRWARRVSGLARHAPGSP